MTRRVQPLRLASCMNPADTKSTTEAAEVRSRAFRCSAVGSKWRVRARMGETIMLTLLPPILADPQLIKIGLCLVAIGVLRWIDMMK